MKKLTMIIPETLQETLADILKTITEVKGFTFIHVEGHGEQLFSDKERDSQEISIRDLVSGYSPKVRADLLLQDQHVEVVLVTLRASKLDLSSQILYWTTPVDVVGKL